MGVVKDELDDADKEVKFTEVSEASAVETAALNEEPSSPPPMFLTAEDLEAQANIDIPRCGDTAMSASGVLDGVASVDSLTRSTGRWRFAQ